LAVPGAFAPIERWRDARPRQCAPKPAFLDERDTAIA
jgi:hypothetical protein